MDIFWRKRTFVGVPLNIKRDSTYITTVNLSGERLSPEKLQCHQMYFGKMYFIFKCSKQKNREIQTRSLLFFQLKGNLCRQQTTPSKEIKEIHAHTELFACIRKTQTMTRLSPAKKQQMPIMEYINPPPKEAPPSQPVINGSLSRN